MRFRLLRMSVTAVLALMGLAVGVSSADAQCGGGGYYRGGGYGGGRAFAQSYGGYGRMGGGGCGMMMGSMNMGGMAMGGMPMAVTQAPTASMPGMSMSANAAPVAAPTPAPPPAAPTAAPTAGAMYYCPMHPGVMSTFPAICPYCQMALKKR